MIIETILLIYPKPFPDVPLTNPQEGCISNDTAHLDPVCMPTTVAQSYQHFSKTLRSTTY